MENLLEIVYFNCGSNYKSFVSLLLDIFQATIGLLNVNNGSTVIMPGICSKFKIKTSERNVFINFKVKNRNTKVLWKICSKLTIKTSE